MTVTIMAHWQIRGIGPTPKFVGAINQEVTYKLVSLSSQYNYRIKVLKSVKLDLVNEEPA